MIDPDDIKDNVKRMLSEGAFEMAAAKEYYEENIEGNWDRRFTGPELAAGIMMGIHYGREVDLNKDDLARVLYEGIDAIFEVLRGERDLFSDDDLNFN